MSLDPDRLQTYPDVVDELSWTFDFVAELQPRDPPCFSVDGGTKFRLIGRDGAGGQFAELADGAILYASSEGQAGIIASGFEEFIRLLIALPHWRDVLKFSAGGQLDQMRRAATALESSGLGEEEELAEARALLKAVLSLTDPDDPVGTLHRAVSAAGVTIRDPYGNSCMSLFNRFTIDDNPLLRGLDA
jgi:hypothetical protein